MAFWSLGLILCLLGLAGLVQGKPYAKRSSQVCYERVGCFSGGKPFYSLTTRPLNLLPESPDEIRTQYLLFTRPNTKRSYALDARYPDIFKSKWPNYRDGKPLKIIVHGFLDSMFFDSWLNSTKDALLAHDDYNVVLVDWNKGNFFPYTQATGNTRLVGAQIADLILTLEKSAGLSVKDVHIIGHSLGAHVAGYAGERVPGLGRISGLDPAGPYFEGTDRMVRLDDTDADFVDVLHTDAEILLKIGMGTRESVGHVDFWPNLGHDQPGCKKSPLQHLFGNVNVVTGGTELIACNHLRAVKYFLESIVSPNSFQSFPCPNEETFKKGWCYTCGDSVGCSRMGFFADQVKPSTRTNFFLTTAPSSPFAENHLLIDVHMSTALNSERGILKAQVVGGGSSSQWFDLNDSPQEFQGGHQYSFWVGSHNLDLTRVDLVRLSWDHDSTVWNPLKWNPFGLRHPKIYIDQVHVTMEGTWTKTKFCANDASIEDDEKESLKHKC